MPKRARVCCSALTPTPRKKMKDAVYSEERFIQIASARLFVKTWTPDAVDDDEAPIILFHDSLGCTDLWRSFPEALAQRTKRYMIGYDRIGFGKSSPRSDALAPDFIQREGREIMPQICAALNINEFIACGHSVGGCMAMEAAANMPAHCRAVITIASQAFTEDKTLDGIRAAQKNLQEPAQFAKLEKYHGKKTKWVVDSWTNTWLSPAFAGWNLDSTVANVGVPVFAIHGENDEYGSIAHPQRIAANGVILSLPDTGHFPHREKEKIVVQEIQNFIDWVG